MKKRPWPPIAVLEPVATKLKRLGEALELTGEKLPFYDYMRLQKLVSSPRILDVYTHKYGNEAAMRIVYRGAKPVRVSGEPVPGSGLNRFAGYDWYVSGEQTLRAPDTQKKGVYYWDHGRYGLHILIKSVGVAYRMTTSVVERRGHAVNVDWFDAHPRPDPRILRPTISAKIVVATEEVMDPSLHRTWSDEYGWIDED